MSKETPEKVKAIQLAQVIAETFPHLLIDRTGNTVTLEDTEGTTYLVTVEPMYRAGTETTHPSPSEE